MPAAGLPWELVSGGEEETVALGRRLAPLLRPGTRVLLTGELGAGKTCLTRGLAEALGVDPAAVHSPSFSVVHRYVDGEGRPVLYHVDLYRVEGEVDRREIGLEEALASEVPAAVEWAERLAGDRLDASEGDLLVRLDWEGRDRRRIRVIRR